MSSKNNYKYNTKGKLIEVNNYFTDTAKLRTKHYYKYDKKGNKIQTIFYRSTNLISKINSKYDKNGNQIELQYFNSEKLQDEYVYKYKYDAQKNWVKKVVFQNGLPVKIIERTYTYYN